MSEISTLAKDHLAAAHFFRPLRGKRDVKHVPLRGLADVEVLRALELRL